MKKVLTQTIGVMIFVVIFASCSKVDTVEPLPTEEKQTTPIIFPTSTTLPTITSTTRPTITPSLSSPAEATIEAFDSLCLGAQETSTKELSPNGKWVAALCYAENGTEDSPLQVVSLDHTKEWRIYYRDYATGEIEYGRKNIIIPYHWSRDGNFLYAVSPTISSGCCWIGGKYVFLVRINLETGEQTEMVHGVASFTISEDDRFLLFTPAEPQPYDFSVLDLLSGETRVVYLKESKEIDLEYAIMSPDENIIVLPLFRNIEFNEYAVESIVSINLASNEQRILVSGLEKGEELFPIRWIDKQHILISNTNPFASSYFFDPPIEYWSLDINTGEREKVDLP